MSDEPKKLWWVSGEVIDSMGIVRCQPFYSERSEHEAHRTVRIMSSGIVDDPAAINVIRWVVDPPDTDWQARISRETELAHSGVCPTCHSKSNKTGTSRGYKALKCGRCGHVWRIAGTYDESKRRFRKPSREESLTTT